MWSKPIGHPGSHRGIAPSDSYGQQIINIKSKSISNRDHTLPKLNIGKPILLKLTNQLKTLSNKMFQNLKELLEVARLWINERGWYIRNERKDISEWSTYLTSSTMLLISSYSCSFSSWSCKQIKTRFRGNVSLRSIPYLDFTPTALKWLLS